MSWESVYVALSVSLDDGCDVIGDKRVVARTREGDMPRY